MNSIKIYILPLILMLFFSVQTFSQNDFYNDKEEKIEQKASKTDSILVYGYFTEKDYNEMHGIKRHKKNVDSEFYYEDEIYGKEERKKKNRDNFLTEVAAEVVVEVFINTLFVLATFWH